MDEALVPVATFIIGVHAAQLTTFSNSIVYKELPSVHVVAVPLCASRQEDGLNTEDERAPRQLKTYNITVIIQTINRRLSVELGSTFPSNLQFLNSTSIITNQGAFVQIR